jgi:hypothetical protein
MTSEEYQRLVLLAKPRSLWHLHLHRPPRVCPRHHLQAQEENGLEKMTLRRYRLPLHLCHRQLLVTLGPVPLPRPRRPLVVIYPLVLTESLLQTRGGRLPRLLRATAHRRQSRRKNPRRSGGYEPIAIFLSISFNYVHLALLQRISSVYSPSQATTPFEVAFHHRYPALLESRIFTS